MHLRKWLAMVAVLALAGFSTAVYLIFSSPRMKVQPNIREFDAQMPLPPEGSVTVQKPVSTAAPAPEEAAALKNPLPADEKNLEAGKIYYEMHCAFCHGRNGAGDGPVGASYVPVPSNIASDKVKAMSDGELLRAMLTGTGHSPVLERVIPLDRRWPIVLYVRTLTGEPTPPPVPVGEAPGSGNP